MMHRDEWLDAIQRRDVDDIELDVRDATVARPGHDRHGPSADGALKYLGRDIEDCVLLTDVWVKDDDRWQAIRRHSTPGADRRCAARSKEGENGWRRRRGHCARAARSRN